MKCISSVFTYLCLRNVCKKQKMKFLKKHNRTGQFEIVDISTRFTALNTHSHVLINTAAWGS